MTEHKVFNDLASIALDNFKDKPTSLTAGQQEASSILWTSTDGHCKTVSYTHLTLPTKLTV